MRMALVIEIVIDVNNNGKRIEDENSNNLWMFLIYFWSMLVRYEIFLKKLY